MPTKNRQQAPKTPRRAIVGKDMAHVLQSAAGAALNAYVAVFGLPPDLPDEAFDSALMADAEYQTARKAFNSAWKRVSVLLPDPTARLHLLRLEEAANALAVAAASTGWRLGLVTRGTVQVDTGEVAPGGRKGSSTTRGAARGKRG